MAAVRILFCASESPRGPLNGSRLVSFQLCSRLASRHDVTVLALRHPDQDGDAPAGVELYELPLAPPSRGRAWALRGAALALREPVEARRLSAPFVSFLPGFLASRRFDVAHVMLGTLAPIAPVLGGLPAVIAPLDAWHRNVEAEAASADGLERGWRVAQASAVRRFEARAYRPFARVVLVTDEDAREVAALDPSLVTETIPNGVDARRFAPVAMDRAGILFTGALDAPANEQAAVRLAERIMPLVRRSMPDAALDAGRAIARAARARAGRDRHRRRSRPAPVPLGRRGLRVPDGERDGDQEQAARGDGGGCARGRFPLACQGMSVRDGVELRIASSDEAFACALVSVLRAPDGLADAARAYVTAHHDWDAVADAYSAVYERIAA